jgi:hypothetical protein
MSELISNIEQETKDRIKHMPWKHTMYHLISAGFIIEGLPANVKEPYHDPLKWSITTTNKFFDACFADQISIRPANDIKTQTVMYDLQAQLYAGEDCMPKKGRGPWRDGSAANVAANSFPSPLWPANSTMVPGAFGGSKKIDACVKV